MSSIDHTARALERPRLRRIARLLVVAQAIYPLAGIAPAHAQAQAAPTPSLATRAGQRPIIDAARNGVPIVHIAPPSAAGVSRNQYGQFDVGASGLILNNSATHVQTQLGGWVSGNMQLGPTPARIILNEVVSTGAGAGASQLKGFIEVAGQRADIVIANPNGISCDGCGFLNTNGRATLATGVPHTGGRGELNGFNVGTGQIHVRGGGLNATNLERLDLIARGLVIEGEVWAKNLQVVTGANQVLYGTLGATPQNGTAAAPRFAIDIKELGGMYANQIYMVATEQGLGVNSTGRIAALQGNMILNASGDLALRDSYAKQDLQLVSGGATTLTGVTQSAAGMTVRSVGAFTQQGVMASTGPLDITAARLDNAGTLYSAGSVNISAAQVNDANGTMIAVGELNIAARDIGLRATRLSTDAKLTLAASAGNVSLANAQVYAGGDIDANASGSVTNTGGSVQSSRSIVVRAGSVVNHGGTVLAGGALRVTTPGAIDNTGGSLMGAAAVDLIAASLTNEASGTSRALVASERGTRITTNGVNAAGQGLSNVGGTLSGKTELVVATGGGSLDNAGGTLVSDNALHIASGALGNVAGQIVSRALQDTSAVLAIDAASVDNRQGLIDAGASLQLGSTGQLLNNDAGRITAQGAIDLRAGAVDNRAGQLIANRSVSAQVAALDNSSGVVSAADAVRIDSNGAVLNAGGELSSNGRLHVAGSRLDNTRGDVSAGATELRFGAGDLLNTQGRILGTQALALQHGTLGNAGGAIATGSALAIDTSGQAFDNAGGTLQVGGPLRVTSGRLDNAAGRIATSTSLALDAAAVDNRGGQLVSDGALVVTAAALDNTRGLVSANASDLRLGTGTLVNAQGELIGAQKLLLQSGAIANAGGTIRTGSALTLNTGGRDLDNSGGTIQAGAAMSVGAGMLNNRGGKLLGSAALRIDSQSLANDAGRIVAAGALTLRSGDIANTGAALISAAADLDIAATQLDTSTGTLQAGQDLRLLTDAALINRGGTVVAERDIALQAGSLNNDAGFLSSNGNLDLRAGAVSNRAGQIAAIGSAAVTLASLDNSSGRIVANRALTLSARGGQVDNDGGVIMSAQMLNLDVGRLGNRAGLISGAGGAHIASEALNNRSGELSSAGALAIDTQGQTLDNTAGRIASQGALDMRAGVIRNDADTQAASIASNGTLSLRASGLSNRGSSIDSAGTAHIDAGGGLLDNAAGSIAIGSGLSLVAGALGNQRGQIVANRSIDAALARLDNTGGLISAADAMTLASAGNVDNSRGRVISNGAIGLAATGLNNTQGTISAQGVSVQLGTGAFDNHLGTLVGTQALALQTGAIANVGGTMATGAALALDTAGQDLDNSGGTVQATVALSLRAGRLTNTGGTLSSAGNVGIASQDLVNSGGRIAAVGDLGVQSVSLNNDTGELTSNADLSVRGGAVSNRRGQIGALGTVAVSVTSLDTSAGRIVASRSLTLTTQDGSLVNDAGVITSAQRIAIDAGALSNKGGLISSASGSRIGSQALNNSGGEVSSSGVQSLDTHGQSLINTGGRITAQGALDLQAGAIVNDASATRAALIAGNATLDLRAASLSNRGSSLSSVSDAGIALGGGALDNTGGTLSSTGSLTLSAGAATNTAVANAGGVISAQGTLQATLASLDNTRGQLVAGGASTLVASGVLVNDQGRIATNAGLALTAGSLSNRAGQIGSAQAAALGVGSTLDNDAGAIQAEALSLRSGALSNVAGLIASNTTLGLNTGIERLNNDSGTIQAIVSAEIRAGQTGNTGGRVLAGQSLDLTTLALSNAAGEIASGGSARIATQGQSLVNDAGRIAADIDLTLNASALGNAQAGVIAAGRDAALNVATFTNSGSLQAGRDLALAATGGAVNSGALNAQRKLALQSASLSNDAGLLAANGDVSIVTGDASNRGGSVQVAGALGFSAASLDNRSGQIVGTGNTALALGGGQRTGSLDNGGGTIASAQALSLVAGGTSNRLGQIVGGSGLIASTHALDNSGGVIGSQAALTLDSHAFLNTGGTLQAQGALSLTAGAIGNTGGARILANEAVAIVASSFDNTDSTISAGTRLEIDASGALANGRGRIAAGGSANIRAAGLSSNAQGRISAAQTLGIDTATGAIDNAGGTFVAALGLQVASGALDNRAGMMASTQGALNLDTRGQGLVNDEGALQAFGNATLSTGALSNRAGLVSGHNLDVSTAALDNDGGSIVAKGALAVDARSVVNRAGLMQSSGALSIDTHGGDLVNTGSGAHKGISAGGSLGIRAGRLDNQTGVIVSDRDQTLTLSGDLDNRNGLVSSNGSLGIAADNALVDNRDGRIVAGSDLTFTAAVLRNSGTGSSIAAANIGITVGSLDNSAGGSIVAQNNASIVAASLDNTGGSLSAKGRLDVSATQLVNTNGQIVGDGGVNVSTASSAPGGNIASANNLALSIAGDYTNTGLLSARGSLSISAANIGNSGTLRAEHALALSTGNLVNSGEISSQNTTITASGTLTNSGLIDGISTRVIAGTLANTGRIYGDALAVGGGTVNNSGSGVIAARDSLRLGATALNNTGGGLVYAINDIAIGGSLGAQGQPQGAMQTLLNASSTIEAGRDLGVSALALTNRNDGLITTQITGPVTALPVMLQPSGWAERYPLSRFIGYGGETVHFIVHPDLYGLRSVMQPAMVYVAEGCIELNDSGGYCWPARTDYNYAWNSPVFAQFGVTPPTADSATWDAAYAALNIQIDAYNAGVNEDNRTVGFEDYTIYTLTSSGSSTQLVSTAPAKLLSGRDMTLTGTVNNLDSQIVAGRNLFVSGAGVINVATKGTTTTTVSGSAQFSHVDRCGTFGTRHCRKTDGAVAYNPAPETTHPDLPTVVYLANAAGAVGMRSLVGSGASADPRSAGNAAGASGGLAQSSQSITAAIGGTQGATQAGRSSSGAGAASNVQGSTAGTQAVTAQTAATAAVQTSLTGGANASAAPTERGIAGASSANPALFTIGTVIHGGSRLDAVPVDGSIAARSADIVPAAATAAAPTRLAPPTVQRVSAVGAGARASDVILTVLPRLALPTSSLFRINAAPSAKYLVETDPRFTNGRTFLSSDHFLTQLQLDPERTLARYGDGFEEQRLVADQVLALTGRRYLAGYTDTESEYTALMNAGVAFARQYQLAPGVALSAEQMALLTTDIVWLTTRTVTLADGSTRQVLVPEVYIRRPQAEDLSPSGALMAASNVFIQTTGDLANRGTIQGDTVTLAADRDILNQGTVRGQDVYARAERDLTNLGGSFIGAGDGAVSNSSTLAFSAGRDIVLQTTTQTSVNAQSTRTSIDRIATVQGGNISFAAARDFVASGANVSAAQDLQAAAARNIDVNAVQGSLQIEVPNLNGNTGLQGRSGYIKETSTTQQQSNLTAGNGLSLVALGDLNLMGGSLNAANDAYLQGANVTIEAAKASQSIDIQTVQKRSYDRATKSDETLVGGVITAGNNLAVVATGDATQAAGNINVTGATLAAAAGQTALIASGDVTIQAAMTQHATSNDSAYQYSGGVSGVYAKSKQSQSERSTQSSQVQASNVSGNTLLIQTGDLDKKTGDITLLGSNLSATGAASLRAGRDIIVDTVDQTSSRSEVSSSSSSFELGNRTVNQAVAKAAGSINRVADPIMGSKLPAMTPATRNAKNGQATQSATQVAGSSISADTLSASSGRDALIRGSAVVTTGDLAIDAGRNLEILTSRNTQQAQDSRDKRLDGIMSGGISMTVGTREQTASSQQSADTAAGSQVASLAGNVTLKAGDAYRQSGSQVLALGQNGTDTGGDIAIAAKQVDITHVTSSATDSRQQSFSQSGVTVAISNPLITALQTGVQMAESAGNTGGDARLQALAAATAVLAAAQAAQSIADGSAASIGINVSVGESKSSSKSTEHSRTAQGSSIGAARDLSINATAGDVRATGSQLQAGRDASLDASGNISLQAAASTAEQRGVNDSASNSIGVGFNVGSQNGFTINASASKGLGRSDGSDTVYTNTTVKAGGTASLASGGGTSLKGATVQANRVVAAVGGNLNIESLQDKSVFDAKQTSAGVAVSLCIPPICYGTSSVSASYANAKAVSDFASVVEQSGIKAGDGGFQIKVAGNTDLKGGVISASQAAIDAGKNSLTTATLTTSDITNRDAHEASAISASAMVSGKAGDQSSASTPAQQNAANGQSKPAGSAGFGSESGGASSVTRSGISAGTITITDDAAQQALTGKDSATTLASLNTKVTTDKDTSAALTKAWDGQRLLDKVQASAQITAAFGAAAAKEVADYAQKQAKELRDQGREEEAKKWDEGGSYRVAVHAAVGGLGGGVGGALGSGSAAVAAPAIDAALSRLDLPEPVKQAVGIVAAGAIGSIASGGSAASAGAAFNTDVNNRQLHPREIDWIASNAKRFADKLAQELGRPVTDIEAMQWLTYAGESNVDNAMQRSNGNFVRGTANLSEGQAYDAAKAFIATQAKAGFVDEIGQGQQLFTAKNGDLYMPEVYSQWANNRDYRDYYWSVQGINLKPDNPTPQEQATYDQRQSQVNAAKVEQLVVAGVAIGGAAVAVKVAGSGTVDPKGPLVLTGKDLDAQRIENNLTRDGGIADPSKPMSAAGPWTPAAALTPAQVDAAIQNALPAGAKVVGTQSADALNAIGSARGWVPSFVPGSQIVEVTTAQPTQFVRVYGGGSSNQAGGWLMRADDIAGLTPQQIASKFALPEVPTMVTDATVPAGTRLEVSAANGISPNAGRTGARTGDNGGGGGVQFQIKTQFFEGQFEKLFTNPRPLPLTGGN